MNFSINQSPKKRKPCTLTIVVKCRTKTQATILRSELNKAAAEIGYGVLKDIKSKIDEDK